MAVTIVHEVSVQKDRPGTDAILRVHMQTSAINGRAARPVSGRIAQTQNFVIGIENKIQIAGKGGRQAVIGGPNIHGDGGFRPACVGDGPGPEQIGDVPDGAKRVAVQIKRDAGIDRYDARVIRVPGELSVRADRSITEHQRGTQKGKGACREQITEKFILKTTCKFHFLPQVQEINSFINSIIRERQEFTRNFERIFVKNLRFVKKIKKSPRFLGNQDKSIVLRIDLS